MNITDFIIAKKYYILAFGLVIFAAELTFWLRPWQSLNPSVQAPSVFLNQPESGLTPARLILQAENSQVAVGENITVSVNLSSVQPAEAVDAIISFDPAVLQVVGLEPGTAFNEYPQQNFDNTNGKIYLSAVSDLGSPAQTEPGVKAGNLGTITFSAINSGQTDVNLDFEPGATTDSNVVAQGTTDDILGAVENLQITVK